MNNPEIMRPDLFEGTGFAIKKEKKPKRTSHHIRAERGFRDLGKMAEMAGRRREIEEKKERN